MNQRSMARSATNTPVACRLMSTQNDDPNMQGTMVNYSPGGTYIESWFGYKQGTVVMLRIEEYPAGNDVIQDETPPRSISLAEVKWVRQIEDRPAVRFGIGLRYI
jgi:hypothetical protein